MTGYLYACGEALPADTPCGCTADYDGPCADECTCSDPAVWERHERAWENSRDFDPTKRWPPRVRLRGSVSRSASATDGSAIAAQWSSTRL